MNCTAPVGSSAIHTFNQQESQRQSHHAFLIIHWRSHPIPSPGFTSNGSQKTWEQPVSYVLSEQQNMIATQGDYHTVLNNAPSQQNCLTFPTTSWHGLPLQKASFTLTVFIWSIITTINALWMTRWWILKRLLFHCCYELLSISKVAIKQSRDKNDAGPFSCSPQSLLWCNPSLALITWITFPVQQNMFAIVFAIKKRNRLI